MDQSDAYVICNPNSYEGFMVSTEFGYAVGHILHSSDTLKKIYFTNTPLGYDKFCTSANHSFENFLENLYKNPNWKNELAYYKKIKESKDSFKYNSERDFYDDLQDMYLKLLFLQSRGGIVIGIESLLDKNKNTIQSSQQSIADDDEYEL